MSKRRAPDKSRLARQPNHCFGCGPDNPDSMRLEFVFDEAGGKVLCEVTLGDRYTGPPRHCHGGIIATMLDEVMAKLNKLHGITAMTAEISVKYLRPVPLHTQLKLEAHEVRVEGRRRFREAEIADSSGMILARAQGVFVTVNPERISTKPI